MSSSQSSSHGSTTTGLQVLLVDDEDLLRRAGQTLLSALGHQATLACNGQEAIELIEAQTFDVVILDWTMPVMSGKEAFAEIRKRWPDLPVAICTGYAIDPKSWLSNADCRPPFVLQKPYSVADLMQFLLSCRQVNS